MNRSLIEKTIKEVFNVFDILKSRLSTSIEFLKFMRELGWDFPADKVPDFSSNIGQHISNLQNSIVELDISTTFEEHQENYATLIHDFLKIIDDLKNVGSFFSSLENWPNANDFFIEFPHQLFNYLIIEHIEKYRPGIYILLRMTDTIRIEDVQQTDGRLTHRKKTFDFSKFVEFLRDPAEIANNIYKWGSAQFEEEKLLDQIEDTCVNLGIPAGQYLPNPTIASKILGISNPTFQQMGKELCISIYENPNQNIGYIEVGLSIYPLIGKQEPSGNYLNPGIAIIPYVNGRIDEAIQLGGGFELRISGDLSAGISIELRPEKINSKTNLLNSSTTNLTTEFKVSVSKPKNIDCLRIIDGPGNSFLDIQDISQSIGVTAAQQDTFDAYWELNIQSCQFVISADEGDGFLNKILPSEPIKTGFDITAGWSSKRGVYFQGSSSLETTIPIHMKLGPLSLETLHFSISTEAEISVAIAVSARAELGPISASINQLGLSIPLEIKSNYDGNIGPIQIDKPEFKPPTGVGLLINTSSISGGGYLNYSKSNGRYVGCLDMQLGEIGLTAIGLIITKLPDDKPGYALFINIGVTFNPPITLPYNFNLQGVGGLLAVNRTMDVEALRSGLRNRTLGSVLFPEDPILNANKIINDSERVFPIEEGRFVVGPMVKIGWGANGLITADIAVVIELPSPIIIALLGQINAMMPSADKAIVVLNLDVLGVLDLCKKTLSIDATLYDSKIITYQLWGDAALRLCWGSTPMFGLSLGGWHPRFSPPTNFPKLRRLTLQLSSSNSLDLSCTVYQALTSNTLQFGAGLRLHAEACGASLDGKLSFDTLIVFSPFEFEVDINGKLSVRYKGHKLASVTLNLFLSGPTPWHAKGKAKFSILFWDVTAHFSKTWGRDDKARIPEIDPIGEFLREIRNISNWSAALPSRRSAVESLKSLESSGDNSQPQLLIHPAGALEVRQRLLPLGLQLDKYANANVKNHSIFDLDVSLGSAGTASDMPPIDVSDVQDYFARGQFKSLTKSERLSKASYEQFKAGVLVGPSQARIDGKPQVCELEYESILIKPDGASEIRKAGARWGVLQRTIRGAALQRTPLQRRGLGKFKTAGKARVAVTDEAYTIVERATLMPATGFTSSADRNLSQTEAEDLVSASAVNNLGTAKTVLVVPMFEAEPA